MKKGLIKLVAVLALVLVAGQVWSEDVRNSPECRAFLSYTTQDYINMELSGQMSRLERQRLYRLCKEDKSELAKKYPATATCNSEQHRNAVEAFQKYWLTKDVSAVDAMLACGLITPRDKELVVGGFIAAGMSEAAIQGLYGAPSRVNTSGGSWGTEKQYVFRHGPCVYVRGGLVVAWN